MQYVLILEHKHPFTEADFSETKQHTEAAISHLNNIRVFPRVLLTFIKENLRLTFF